MTLRISRRRRRDAWLATAPLWLVVNGKRRGLADVTGAARTLGGTLRRWADRLQFYSHLFRTCLDAASTRKPVALVVRDTGKRWRVRT